MSSCVFITHSHAAEGRRCTAGPSVRLAFDLCLVLPLSLGLCLSFKHWHSPLLSCPSGSVVFNGFIVCDGGSVFGDKGLVLAWEKRTNSQMVLLNETSIECSFGWRQKSLRGFERESGVEFFWNRISKSGRWHIAKSHVKYTYEKFLKKGFQMDSAKGITYQLQDQFVLILSVYTVNII